MTIIALLNDNRYFIDYHKDVKDFLVAYAEYIGAIDMRVFTILANSNEMSTKELIEYINKEVYSWEEQIVEIYEVGKKIY